MVSQFHTGDIEPTGLTLGYRAQQSHLGAFAGTRLQFVQGGQVERDRFVDGRRR